MHTLLRVLECLEVRCPGELSLAVARARAARMAAGPTGERPEQSGTAVGAAAMPQLAVIGPTQVGKSTVVNLLARRGAAGVSPLAGFTRTAQEFVVARPGGAVCVWDSPDFDSTTAVSYQNELVGLLGRADALLLVVSKEKYADLSVWNLVRTIAPLGLPLAVCMNKLSPDAHEAGTSTLRARLREHGLGDDVRILPLPYDARLADDPAGESAPVAALRDAALGELVARCSEAAERTGLARLMRANWDQWLAPLRARHAAMAQFSALVRAQCAGAQRDYQSEFLDHPQRYDTFGRAALELLTLLEIPVFAEAVARVRQVVTWPVRQAWRALAGRSDPRPAAGNEEQTLVRAVQDALLTLRLEALRRASAGGSAVEVWTSLAERLAASTAQLEAEVRERARAHVRAFEPQIHGAARGLYDQLRQRPALLHAMRAARATTDLAAVVLAVKTPGGLLHDALLAPAFLSLNSMLAESAAGAYYAQAARDLKDRQLVAARQEFFAPIEAALHGLGAPDGAGDIDVSPEELLRAEAELTAWEQRG